MSNTNSTCAQRYRPPQLPDFTALKALPANAYLLMRKALRTIQIAAYDPFAFVIQPVRGGLARQASENYRQFRVSAIS